MAFPTGWTIQHKIDSDPDKVSGTANLTDFPSLLTEDNFAASVFTSSQGKEINSNYLLNDANLQGYWRLESSGADSSGNSYTLTGSGSPVYTTGKFGNGVDLESGSTQYLSGTGFTNVAKNGSRTVSFWIKPESFPGNPTIFRCAGSTAGLWDIVLTGSTNKIYARQKQSGTLTNYIGTETIRTVFGNMW